ncbi:TIGR04133 family radical SAM/SPASM protein [Prevotella sp. kh1p2]|uniref:TIGR04133 family radical SAM/SPASM protein n=1 Tax=Prevotella sp. kh1p2 TaxID=1761883 RepID=UPI0008ACDA9D|nr:TIGR04133 family radical SAM/SPASM protein [Prevotella sp. kh1p2]SES81187.1 radical SAM enzyme, rSAM/lipoprotein system [Prevotella sp. kh1p2]SNU10755.1 radical SAM enzyme, rSAM/lipoprotein system [Prevotellaceae bacterium KH2P17]
MINLKKRVALEAARIIRHNVTAEHPLRHLFWECTLRCNLHCRHCGSDCRQASATPDMPAADFLRVLDEVAARTNPNNVFVIITGGEPLMRPDLAECGRAIHDKGFPWGMVTNALALTPERYRQLLAAGLGSVTVSLDGLEESHNWMRGNEHSFGRVAQAIEMMTATPGLTYDVLTCVNQRNYRELPAIRSFLVGKGVGRWRVVTVFPVGRAAKDPEMRLEDTQFRGVFEFIKETRQQAQIHASYGCEGFLGNYEGQVRDHFYFCHAGITVGSVLCDGSISACASIRPDYHQGNIYRDNFMDVWERRFQVYRNRAWARQGECAECSMFRYCEGGGMHLHDETGRLLFCHYHRLTET